MKIIFLSHTKSNKQIAVIIHLLYRLRYGTFQNDNIWGYATREKLQQIYRGKFLGFNEGWGGGYV